MRIRVQNVVKRRDIAKLYNNAVKLKSTWCKCDDPEFLVYMDDNACLCGIKKHHVHCKNCGRVMQIG